MSVCKKCGIENDDGAIFCRNCGQKIEVESEEQKTENNEVVQEPQSTGAEKKNNTLIPTIISIAVVVIVGAMILIPKYMPSNSAEFDDTNIVTINQTDEEYYKEPVKNDLINIGRIDSIIATDANGADISVCVADIKNNVIYATDNAEYSMSASALVNIPILYTVAKELENGSCAWNSQVNFQYKFAGRGTIKKEQDGNYFDLDYLVRQMLNYSDNNATNSLIDYFGREYINNICDRNSFDSIDVQRYLGESSEYKDNYISAKDATEMLAEIYTSSNDDINKDYLLSHFNIYDDARFDGVGRNLSSNVTFLNHNAVTNSIYNEIAIVVSDNAEYVITVLCNNGQRATSADTVSKISDYVYGALSQ